MAMRVWSLRWGTLCAQPMRALHLVKRCCSTGKQRRRTSSAHSYKDQKDASTFALPPPVFTDFP
eukprot:1092144-Amphidinium_carterae.1